MTSVVYAVGTSDQPSVSWTYDANDNPATYTDELNRVTNFTYDALDRLVQQQDPPPDPNQPNVRPVTSQVWDLRGNLMQVTDPLAYVTSYAYDPGSDGDNPQLNRLTEPDPTGGTNYTITTFGHDNAGNLTTITDPMSRLTTLGYDADNQQTSTQLPNSVGGGTGGAEQFGPVRRSGRCDQVVRIQGERDRLHNKIKLSSICGWLPLN